MPQSAAHPLRIALLQARNPGDPARDDEHRAFAARLGLPESALTAVDALTAPLGEALFGAFDLLLVGGSGEYSVLDDHPAIHRFNATLAEAAERGFPTFASCFGFQALVLGLGGEVIHDEPQAEVGAFWLERSDAAAQDPLFATMPTRFLAQLGHKDRATRLPDGLIHLAASPRCPFQAVRVAGKPIYATQFHPEMTWDDTRSRIRRYLDLYGHLVPDEVKANLDGDMSSPEANDLLPRFVALYRAGELG